MVLFSILELNRCGNCEQFKRDVWRFFRILLFPQTNNSIWVWTDIRFSKYWQNFNFQLNYAFKSFTSLAAKVTVFPGKSWHVIPSISANKYRKMLVRTGMILSACLNGFDHLKGVFWSRCQNGFEQEMFAEWSKKKDSWKQSVCQLCNRLRRTRQWKAYDILTRTDGKLWKTEREIWWKEQQYLPFLKSWKGRLA